MTGQPSPTATQTRAARGYDSAFGTDDSAIGRTAGEVATAEHAFRHLLHRQPVVQAAGEAGRVSMVHGRDVV